MVVQPTSTNMPWRTSSAGRYFYRLIDYRWRDATIEVVDRIAELLAQKESRDTQAMEELQQLREWVEAPSKEPTMEELVPIWNSKANWIRTKWSKNKSRAV